MALAKKGLRTLTHQGQTFGWVIRAKPTYLQGALRTPMTLAIQSLSTDTPAVLHVTLNIDRPDNWVAPHQTQITPQLIKGIVEAALAQGWQPTDGGPVFSLKYAVIKHR